MESFFHGLADAPARVASGCQSALAFVWARGTYDPQTARLVTFVWDTMGKRPWRLASPGRVRYAFVHNEQAVALHMPDGVGKFTCMDTLTALASLGGAARTFQLLERGCTPFTIRRSVAAGEVLQHSRGVFASPGAAPDTVLAVELSAGFTCTSALELLGLPLPKPIAIPHLAVPRNFNPKDHNFPHARLHYQGRGMAPGSVAGVADALDTAGACLDPTWHLVAVDAALNQGLIVLGDVLRFGRTTKERRDFLLSYADARSQAPGETIARLRLAEAGLKVRPQAYVEGAGHVDLEVEGVLLIQVDGFGPHSGKTAFTRDRVHARAVIKAGRPLLSYAASELLGYYCANVVKDVTEALEEWRNGDRHKVRPPATRIVTIPRASA